MDCPSPSHFFEKSRLTKRTFTVLSFDGPFSPSRIVSAADDPVFTRLVEDGKKQKADDLAAVEFPLKVEKAKEAAIKKAKPGPKGQGASFSARPAKEGEVPVYTYSYSDPKDKEKQLKFVQERISELEGKMAKAKKAERLQCGLVRRTTEYPLRDVPVSSAIGLPPTPAPPASGRAWRLWG